MSHELNDPAEKRVRLDRFTELFGQRGPDEEAFFPDRRRRGLGVGLDEAGNLMRQLPGDAVKIIKTRNELGRQIMKVDRDTAIRAVYHLLTRITRGVDVDFYAAPGARVVDEVRVSHDDPGTRAALTEIAGSVLAQLGHPVIRGDTPAEDLVSLREQARRSWRDESAEALSQERYRDAFGRLRGAIDPEIDLET